MGAESQNSKISVYCRPARTRNESPTVIFRS
jgi:hypothetical protein